MTLLLRKVLTQVLAFTAITLSANAGTYLYSATPYNVFVRNNFTDYNADTWGGVAAGGIVSTTGGFGFASHNPVLAYAVIASIDFSATGSGSISGNLYDGTAGGINNNFTVNGSIVNGPANQPIDFADQFTKLQALSTTLGSSATTAGNGCVNSYGSIVCSAVGSGVNYIDIPYATTASSNGQSVNSYDFGNNYGITINISNPNATVVINVAGTGQRFTGGSGWTVNGGSYQNVIVNYSQATSLTLGTSGITASLLAPYADVYKTTSGGFFDGNFIAKSFTAGGNSATEEFHSNLFTGTLPQPASTPEPGSLLLLVGGIGAMGWWKLRR